MTSQIFSDEKYSYTYWVDGDEKNPLLLLIPGFTGTHGDLLDFAREFRKKYFVVIPDLPGWGESPKGKYHPTISGYAQFLHDLLVFLKTEKKIYLAGHCMGSVITIEFAYKYSHFMKELFLIGVPYLKGNFSDELFKHLAHDSVRVPKVFRPFFFFFRSRFLAIPSGLFVIQTRSLRKKLSLIFHNSIKQQFQNEELVEKNWNSLVLFDYNKLRYITVPIHLFHGEKDMLVLPIQAEKLQKINSQITVDIIPHAGHMPPIETPISLAHAIERYV